MPNNPVAAILATLTLFSLSASAQQRGGGSPLSNAAMPNSSGLQANQPLGAGGSFRPNNSSIGQPLGLSQPRAGFNSNPFAEARTDPQAQGRAGTGQSGQQGFNGANGQFQGQGGAGAGRQGRQGRQGQLGQQGRAGLPGQFGRGAGIAGAGAGINRSGMGARGGSGGQVRRAQAHIRLEFEPVAVPSAEIVRSTDLVLGPQTIPGGQGLEIRVAEGRATLTGTVRTRREADLAAAILSLEPGVRAVDNQLVVEP